MTEEYTYQKKRKEFGRPPAFVDTDTKIVGSVPPEKAQQDKYKMRDPNQITLSNVPQLSQH